MVIGMRPVGVHQSKPMLRFVVQFMSCGSNDGS